MRATSIIFTLIILLALAGLWVVSRSYGATNAGDIKTTDIINTFLTAILILITGYYAWVTNQALKVSGDMAVLMKQANQINFRPYVQIEGVQQEHISGMGLQGGGLPADKIRTGGFLFVFTPENKEFLVYATRNLGHVPARNIKHSAEVYVIDEKGNASRIPISDVVFTTTETLFPSQLNIRQLEVGSGLVLRKDAAGKQIRIKLKVTYNGNQETDSNTYFYSVTLGLHAAKDLVEFNRSSIGGMRIEESDEGIERVDAAPTVQ